MSFWISKTCAGTYDIRLTGILTLRGTERESDVAHIRTDEEPEEAAATASGCQRVRTVYITPADSPRVARPGRSSRCFALRARVARASGTRACRIASARALTQCRRSDSRVGKRGVPAAAKTCYEVVQCKSEYRAAMDVPDELCHTGIGQRNGEASGWRGEWMLFLAHRSLAIYSAHDLGQSRLQAPRRRIHAPCTTHGPIPARPFAPNRPRPSDVHAQTSKIS